MWMSSATHHDENSRVYMLSGEEIKVQRCLSIFEVFYPPEHRQFIMTSLVNLMMDSLQIPMLKVDLHTNSILCHVFKKVEK
ncbi:hypothetical protein GCK72_022418 [Caenorhabditis remanei]|uniref:Uncharacterized protein n=1 Tax=Caenorhabditis remanei TaxID=31234 RepID=A0A6A5FTZ6_CAERE|nr:hypothetical protein GCK72_022418 [Caenorhabditis remanei]KAF1745969.1 hypothetical protein GCK72_022418 [Caenorhabditis remanei]